MVLRKKEVYTVITPIPGFIPRQLAIDILHSHSETITLNPLVLSHRQIKAPRDAAADEYFSTWYEITERVQYIPGIGRLGSGVISFNGCFHDLPWGLQTHIYAPANVDLRVKYRIAGNQPGVEPPERAAGGQEIGLAALGAPADGLYLREDIEIKCNIAMVGLVKSQMKAASKEMVARIIKKAELLDAGVLQAMFEDGKIRTVNPRDKTSPVNSSRSPPLSPSIPYQVPRPASIQQQQGSRPGTSNSQYQYPAQQLVNPYSDPNKYRQAPHTAELPRTEYANTQQQNPGSGAIIMELPGDFYHASPSMQPPPQGTRDRTSTVSSNLSQRSSSADPRNSVNSGGWRYSSGTGGGQLSPSLNGGGESQRTSHSSVSDGWGGGGGPGSPGLDQSKAYAYANELPTHRETPEEHRRGDDLRPAPLAPTPYKAYNPADYARMSR